MAASLTRSITKLASKTINHSSQTITPRPTSISSHLALSTSTQSPSQSLTPPQSLLQTRQFSTPAEMKAQFLAAKKARESTPEGKLEKEVRNKKIAEAEAERIARDGDDSTTPTTAKVYEETTSASESEPGSESESTTENPDKTEKSENPFASPPPPTDILSTLKTTYKTFRTELSQTWEDLLRSERESTAIDKIIAAPVKKQKDDGNVFGGYKGTTEIMVVKHSDSTWEKMRSRLADSPIIREMLRNSKNASKVIGADRVMKKASNIKEDAKEIWETSQNPWVYRISNVWDTFTAEGQFAIATRELRRLDPDFDMEVFQRTYTDENAPALVMAVLKGDTKYLRGQMGDVVYAKISADIRERKKAGVVIDTNILSIDGGEVILCEIDGNNKRAPILLLQFQVQLLNCVRSLTPHPETGEVNHIVEGGEDDVMIHYYAVALQRFFDEETGGIKWKVLDFTFQGGQAYI